MRDEKKEWMTTEQACEYLQVSSVSLYRWRQAGRITGYRLGSNLRYRREDLDALAVPEEPDAEESA